MLGDPQGNGTIVDDDGAPALSIDDVTVTEAQGSVSGAVFTVTLLPASGQTVTVTAQTANGPAPNGATAGQDYTAVTQTITFTPGVTSQTVTVPILADALVELDETFTLNLSSPTNATLARAAARARSATQPPPHRHRRHPYRLRRVGTTARASDRQPSGRRPQG
ncbi:MAG: Calx-beta domain-containing protein [Chloroflexota bacterium]